MNFLQKKIILFFQRENIFFWPPMANSAPGPKLEKFSQIEKNHQKNDLKRFWDKITRKFTLTIFITCPKYSNIHQKLRKKSLKWPKKTFWENTKEF